MPFHDAALQQVIPVLRISSLEGFAGAAHRSTNSCGVLVYTKYVPRRTDDAVPPSPRAGCVTTVYLHPGVDTCTNVLFSLSRCFLCSPSTTSYTHDTHTSFQGPLRHEAYPRITYCKSYRGAVLVSGAAHSYTAHVRIYNRWLHRR